MIRKITTQKAKLNVVQEERHIMPTQPTPTNPPPTPKKRKREKSHLRSHKYNVAEMFSMQQNKPSTSKKTNTHPVQSSKMTDDDKDKVTPDDNVADEMMSVHRNNLTDENDKVTSYDNVAADMASVHCNHLTDDNDQVTSDDNVAADTTSVHCNHLTDDNQHTTKQPKVTHSNIVKEGRQPNTKRKIKINPNINQTIKPKPNPSNQDDDGTSKNDVPSQKKSSIEKIQTTLTTNSEHLRFQHTLTASPAERGRGGGSKSAIKSRKSRRQVDKNRTDPMNHNISILKFFKPVNSNISTVEDLESRNIS